MQHMTGPHHNLLHIHSFMLTTMTSVCGSCTVCPAVSSRIYKTAHHRPLCSCLWKFQPYWIYIYFVANLRRINELFLLGLAFHISNKVFFQKIKDLCYEIHMRSNESPPVSDRLTENESTTNL